MVDPDALTENLPEVLRPPVSRNVELLLDSRIPARVAWVSPSRAPQVVPIWFQWTGAQLVTTTFAGARKLTEISSGATVAVSIDTESFPYRVLRMAGPVELVAVDDLSDEYRLAATRYLGPTAGEAWCTSLEARPQVAMRLSPTRAVASDMSRSTFLADHS